MASEGLSPEWVLSQLAGMKFTNGTSDAYDFMKKAIEDQNERETREEKTEYVRLALVSAFQSLAGSLSTVEDLYGATSIQFTRHTHVMGQLEKEGSYFGLNVEMMYDGVTSRKKKDGGENA